MIGFYKVDKNYTDWLKTFENKIPEIEYVGRNEKFLCGIVFQINECNYFAPVSSNTQKFRTSFLIKDEQGKPLSSIRFSFMFPVPLDLVEILIDDTLQDKHYKRIVQKELQYIKRYEESILKKAVSIYYNALKHPNETIGKNSCNFTLLEQKCLEYEMLLQAQHTPHPSLVKHLNIDLEHDDELQI